MNGLDQPIILAANVSEDGNCVTVAPDTMFPDHEDQYTHGGMRNLALDAARRVCFGCPVSLNCLEGAIERREQFGIWGGMTLRERETLRRNRYDRQVGRQGPSATQEEVLFDLEELVS